MRTAVEATARGSALHTRPYDHPVRRLALIVVAALAFAACGDDGGSSASTTDTTTGDISWIDCPAAGRNIECATLTVPVDYDAPATSDQHGSTIDLGLMRLPAGNASERIGSLLVNPGGPGVPGTDLVVNAAAIWPKRIRDRFDIVAWDPRGTGGSAPIDCVDDLDRYFAEPDPSPDTAEENEVLVDRAQEFDDACEQKNEAMLGHISTVDTTRDLDRIREALGEDTISYMGFSYGSELGATYATLFPTHIRAMVLDGAIDPDLDGVETARAQAIGAEHALDTFLADCSAHRTCAFNNNGDAGGAFDELMAKLDSDPLPPPDRGRPEVGQGVAINAVIQALYTTDLWPALADALDQAQHGDGDGLLALSDTYLERDDDGTWTNSIEAFIAISCLDDPVPRDVASYATLADEFEKLAPRLGRSFASGYQCALWPVPSQPGPTATGAGAPPILVVGTTGDPFTPLEQTKALADALESGVLLVREGEGHTAYGQDECVDDAIDSYLIDLTVPADGTRC
jgi:pimeloyl-ACP methyl ester carboxylesterase